MNIQEAIAHLISRQNLSRSDMTGVMKLIMTGETTPAQIGAFLTALRMKGETVDEVAAAAGVMRELADPVTLSEPGAVDIVGTGGDASSTFNVSTASALVAAAAGVSIAKHGNRAASSKSGAADLLEAAGVNIELNAAQVQQCIEQVNVGFMFAQRHHSAMRHAIGPRRELGTRTIFNLLGPLTNPASATNQVLGVFDEQWVRPLAEVLQQLGSEHAMVVHGNDGMDEITCTGATQVAELHNGEIVEYSITPEEFGLKTSSLADIQVSSPEESLAVVNAVFSGQTGAPRDIVCLNAGAAIYVGNRAENLKEGVRLAEQVLDAGAASDTLSRLAQLTQSFH